MEKKLVRRSDIAILVSYPGLTMVYFASAGLGVASDVPALLGGLGVAAFFLATAYAVALPAWTVLHVLANKGRTHGAVLWIESTLAGLLVFVGFGVYLDDHAVKEGAAWVAAALVGLSVACAPLIARHQRRNRSN